MIIRDKHYKYREAVQIDTTRLRLDGYYASKRPAMTGTVGSYISPLVLWADGTIAQSNLTYAKDHGVKDATRYFGTFEEAKSRYETLLAERGIGFADWGGYRIEGDSLYIQVMSESRNFTVHTAEYRGEIVNKTTFVLHRFKVRSKKGYDDWRYIDRRFHFVPLPAGVKPDSMNWTHERFRGEARRER